MERQQLINAIYDSMNTLKRGLYAQLYAVRGGLKLSTSQLEMAFAIKHLQPTGVGQLATHLYLTPGAVSQVVEALVQLGLVERHSDSTDRRKQTLQLTSRGDQELEGIQRQRQALFTDIMDTMSDQELAQWLQIQQQIITQLTNTNVHPKEI